MITMGLAMEENWFRFRAFAVSAPGEIIFSLFYFLFRYGVLGSINRGTRTCSHGAWWWSRGHHNLFLNK